MKKLNGGRVRRFLRSNVVYVSLAAALLAAGVLGANRIVQQSNDSPTPEKPNHEMVEQTVTGQPDDRTTTTTTTKESITTTTEEEEVAPDLYVLPLSNTVQKPFSSEAPLYSETMQNWRLHLGTDFAGEPGQEIKALARGTVLAVEKDPLWGDVVVIDHSVGVKSRYCGVKATVKVGDEVKVAEVIGTLTEIPCEGMQPPHLHLEMTVDDTPVNPVEAIGLEVRYAEDLTEEESSE